jgi:hypothetical protein
MRSKSFYSLIAVMAFAIVPALALTQSPANAAGKRKADWKAPPAKKAAPKAAATPEAPADQTATVPEAPASPPDGQTTPAPVQDQSQEVLDNDLAMAAAIAARGPKEGYGSALSEVGVLYDANGSSPAGVAGANARFNNFPADVQFVRSPEKALAAGGSGSSWGTYSIKRGEQVLSAGRYISVWRRETVGWKMISELAAGRTNTPPPAPALGGTLPKRPAQLGRATPAPVGVPLTLPTPPTSPEAATTPPTP